MILEDFVKQNKKYCKQESIGLSEGGRDILALRLSQGKGLRKKALLTSYLHGDEPETLQANLTTLENVLQQGLLDSWEIISIPISNPDGKQFNIRYNLNGIDLNRDFIQKKAKETRAITQLYDIFKPEIVLDYHSNLSNNFSCLMLPGTTDIKLCNKIISSYQKIREQTSLANCLNIRDTRYNIVAHFHREGIYILEPNQGLLVEYASQESKITAAIEDYGTELSIEFSTELLKKLR